jgi:hypothetical protein
MTVQKFSFPYPWTGLSDAEINAFLEEHDITVPEYWFALPTADKKSFLNVRNGRRINALSIGRMGDAVLNEPRHPWYQKRNHIRIPKYAESKKYLDADWVGGGGSDVPVNDIVFDTPESLDRIISNPELPFASKAFVDESGSGGKKFVRIVSGTGGTFAHSAAIIQPAIEGDGELRVLFRLSGTEPGTSQSHGVSLLMRQILDDTDAGSSYSLGHIIRTGQTQRIRLLINGVSSVLDFSTAALPFSHNEWVWAVFRVIDDRMKGYYYREAVADPGVFLLDAGDLTWNEAHGEAALSFQGGSALNMDIAELHFTPMSTPSTDWTVLVGQSGTTYGANGNTSPAGGGSYGKIIPGAIASGPIIFGVISTPTSTAFRVRFGVGGNEQVPGVTSFTLTIEGYGTITVTWNGTALLYELTGASAIRTFLLNNIGRSLTVSGFPA